MMSASLTVAAFILMFLPAFALDFLEQRRRIAMLRILSSIGFASAAYCIASGILVLSGWHGALNAVVMTYGHDPAAFPARTVRYWPYGLILAGGFWTVVYAGCLGIGPRRRSAG
jgi:hypothetical protein